MFSRHRMSIETGLIRTTYGQMAERKWSDLPSDLLSPIADRLGLIELLCFRGVCKDWKSASTTASAEIESLPDHEPWFLVYGSNSECILLSNSGKKYTINIPELNGATCLASNKGWLLMFQEGSMFFFCPFSHAKIDLPRFPHSQVTDHVAAFSSPPTFQDCLVAVINRSSETTLELNMLCRGAKVWTNHKGHLPRDAIKTIKGATYHGEEFYFFDNSENLVTFSIDKSWNFFVIIPRPKDKIPGINDLPIGRRMKHFIHMNMKNELGLPENVSISTCGTLVHDRIDKLVLNERIEAAEDSISYQLKGVWIQPRFFQVSPNQSW